MFGLAKFPLSFTGLTCSLICSGYMYLVVSIFSKSRLAVSINFFAMLISKY